MNVKQTDTSMQESQTQTVLRMAGEVFIAVMALTYAIHLLLY